MWNSLINSWKNISKFVYLSKKKKKKINWTWEKHCKFCSSVIRWNSWSANQSWKIMWNLIISHEEVMKKFVSIAMKKLKFSHLVKGKYCKICQSVKWKKKKIGKFVQHLHEKKSLWVLAISCRDKSKNLLCHQLCEKNWEIHWSVEGKYCKICWWVVGIYCKICKSFEKI